MANGIISKEDFETIGDTNIKLNILFGTMIDIKNIMHNQDKKIKKIENRPLYDKVSSFAGGVIGGIIAMLGKIYFDLYDGG